MLPHMQDGSKRGKKVKKKMSIPQCCFLLLILFWVLVSARYCYRVLEQKHGPEARGSIGLVILGPQSAHGEWWMRKCTAFLDGVEARFAVPGWTDDIVEGIGKYNYGQYIAQIRERERVISTDVQAQIESFDPLANARPIGAVAGEMGGFLGGDTVVESASVLIPQPSPTDLPLGSYSGSCQGCVLRTQVLSCAACKDSSGVSHASGARARSASLRVCAACVFK